MPQKRLLLDMDGVLSDIYRQFIQYEFKETNLIGKSEDEAN